MKEWVVVINKGKVLVDESEEGECRLPEKGAVKSESREDDTFVFQIDDSFTSFESDEISASGGLQWVELRKSALILSEKHYMAAAKAEELLYWNRMNRFCQICGSPMKRASSISKRCTECRHEIWPQISPAIIVLVRKGEEALLVHAKNFSRPFYGLVAGFVETGESLEETVRREVLEETSIEIADIKYFASQSWPFPAQLMIGFTANYVSGEIEFADGELSSGGFFTRENIPEIPTPPSIARMMIDAWLEGKL